MRPGLDFKLVKMVGACGKLLKINITQTNEFQASLLKTKAKQY